MKTKQINSSCFAVLSAKSRTRESCPIAHARSPLAFRPSALVMATIFMMGIVGTAVGAEPQAADSSAGSAATSPAPAQAESHGIPAPAYAGDIWSRSTLTGDWGGLRTDLAEKGFTLDWNLTQVGQTVFSGGLDNAWKYGGRSNATMNLDTGKAGLWAGGHFTLEVEGQYGETVNNNTGAMMPVNANGLFPEPGDQEWAIPSFMYTQFFSPQFALFLGKMDVTSGDANTFAHGKGNEQFLNLAFGVNPTLLVGSPYSTLGGGAIILPTKDLVIKSVVLDPNGRADTTGLDDPYMNGPAYVLEGRLTTHFFGLTGHQLLGGLYSSKNYTNIDQPLANLIIPVVPAEQADQTWTIYYNFDQYFYQPEKNVDRGIGFFGRFGTSDGDANPMHYFASGGIGGKGMIPGRDNDQFGIGYYYMGLTTPQRPVDHGLVERAFAENTQGVELFYEIAITPWMHLTPDLQIIDPSATDVDTAWVAGLRLELTF